MMNKATKSIVIVGGGTAGWLIAGRIAAQHKSNTKEGVQVTLIESANKSPINVGEGTWPTMRTTLKKIGISESDFIRECCVSFKQGAKFAGWVNGAKDDFYYHPLVLPQSYPSINLAPYWQNDPLQNANSFSNSVCYQEQLCQLGLAPKLITCAEFTGIANYAYHLDSAKFAVFLQKHCTKKLGIKHVIDDVIAVNPLENGDIGSLTTSNSGHIAADLFVDCSGFSAILLAKHYKSTFVDKSDVLFVNQALAVQLPYQDEADDIASHTISTAQDAGWIWDIGLPSRRGIGYVYSDNHQNEDQAIERLAGYVGKDFDKLTIKKIPINSGHRKVFWKNNCVAVGLASGFLEPLEASSLVLVEMSADMIADQLPANRQMMDIIAKRFNETFTYRWQSIIDFLKLHYILSARNEAFWRDNRQTSSIPESLQELMQLWQYHSPYDHDFNHRNEVFPAASYQYILYGMGFKTDYQLQSSSFNQQEFARQQFTKNQQLTTKACQLLPKNRELLAKISQYGFQCA